MALLKSMRLLSAVPALASGDAGRQEKAWCWLRKRRTERKSEGSGWCGSPDASAANLLAAISQTIEPGTTIQTDGWKGYGELGKHGYGHEIIHHTGEVGENLLPRINLTISLLKRWLLGTHQGSVRPEHLDYYLDEFTFRFNRRTSTFRGLLFYRLLQQAVNLEPVRGKDLIGGKSLGNTTDSH